MHDRLAPGTGIGTAVPFEKMIREKGITPTAIGVEVLSDEDITNRVSEIAAKEHTAKKKSKAKKYDEVDMAQMSLFDTVKDNDIIDEIKDLDMGNMTPIEAMNTLYNLQNKIKNRW